MVLFILEQCLHLNYNYIIVTDVTDYMKNFSIQVPSEMKSTVRARYLVVQRYMHGGILSISLGVDRLWVGKSGNLIFIPYEQYQIDELFIDGVLSSLTPIILGGLALVKSNLLYIGPGGSMLLDSFVQGSRTWTGTSRMGIHNLAIHGTLKAGRLMNHLYYSQGWDSLYTNTTGVLEFESEDVFNINHLQIDGRMVVLSPIIMVAFVPDKGLEMYIGGTVVLDALVSHPSGPWSGQSNITADLISMSTSSRFDSGNTVWTVKELIVGGTLNSQPTEEVKVIIFKVKGTGVATFTINISLKSANLGIETSGILDLDFR